MKYKLFIKLMLVFIVLICLGPFLIKDKEGKPYASIERIKVPQISVPKFSISSLFSDKKKKTEYTPVETEILAPLESTPSPGQEVVKIYTFKDKMGVSHYTNKKPANENYQILYMPVSKEEEKGALTKIREKFGDLAKKINHNKTPSETKPLSEEAKFSLSDIYSQPTKAINEAKELKKKIESDYTERDRMVEALNH